MPPAHAPLHPPAQAPLDAIAAKHGSRPRARTHIGRAAHGATGAAITLLMLAALVGPLLA